MKININPKIITLLLCVGMLVLLTTAFLPIIGIKWQWLRYTYAAGAVLTLIAQLLTKSPSKELRVKRLSHMNVWAAILYCVSAGCLFTNSQDMQNSWVAFLLAGAVLQIYATLMISKLTEKKS
ncbi:MAG: hypothetical protein IKX31_07515 [Muribaculaceae bacterium]|nr:hypothetical protein [Muribaculaceae bacterium]